MILGVDGVDVDQVHPDRCERRLPAVPLLLVGKMRNGPGDMALVGIPAVDGLHIKGFAQGIGQFLPARHFVNGAVPEGQLAFAIGDEQQRRVIVEQGGDGFDADIQMHHGRRLRVGCQKVFALQVIGVGVGEELAHQRLGQRFEYDRQRADLAVGPLPARSADQGVIGVQGLIRKLLFQGHAQHMRGDLIDRGALTDLLQHQVVDQLDGHAGVVGVFGHRQLPF